jgi:hypothetical protein
MNEPSSVYYSQPRVPFVVFIHGDVFSASSAFIPVMTPRPRPLKMTSRLTVLHQRLTQMLQLSATRTSSSPSEAHRAMQEMTFWILRTPSMIPRECFLRTKDFEFVVAPDEKGTAAGSLYVDDDVSIVQEKLTSVEMQFALTDGFEVAFQ